MSLRKKFNTYKIRQKLPAILTITSCVGVVATGILSAKAMYDYLNNKDRFDDSLDVEQAISVSILPTVVGAGTIASFIFARKLDQATIAALSMATASMVDKTALLAKDHKIDTRKTIPKDAIVLDKDGELYLEPVTNLLILAKSETITTAAYKLNRNYQLRGIASLYEYFRLMGVKKADIYHRGVEWCKYIGWNCEILLPDCTVWIDSFVEKDQEYNIIHFDYTPYPIACDVPRFVMDICHCDENDLQYLDGYDSEEVIGEIEATIMDNEVE